MPLQPYFDGQRWHLWSVGPHGELVKTEVVEWCQGRYFAESAAAETDVVFDLLQVYTKHAYFPDVVPIVIAVEHDLLNLSAALWKTDLLFDLDGSLAEGANFAAATELEYTLIVCRSMLDLLQQSIRRLWRRVKLWDGDKLTPTRQLPRSIADIVLKGGSTRRSEEELRTAYKLPESLIQFYLRSADFVVKLRSARDEIVHRDVASPLVFKLERGFAVDIGIKPFSELAAWDPSGVEANRLGSLRYLLAAIVTRTVQVCDDWAATLRRSLALPEDIAPGLNVFIRGYHSVALRSLQRICDTPWERFMDSPLRRDK